MRTRIALEVGHGWRVKYEGGQRVKYFDPGAIGPMDLCEYEGVKYYASHAATRLRKLGYEVDLIFIPATLRERGRLGGGYDVFVSCHLNSYNRQAQGTECLTHVFPDPVDIRLATTLQRNLVAELKLRDRGVKHQELAVLKAVPEPVTRCLVEPFFIDSIGTATQLWDTCDQAAKGLADGLHEFFTTITH